MLPSDREAPGLIPQRIVSLVRHHLICYTSDWSDTAVRRWLKRVGLEVAPQLYELGRADARGKGRPAEEDLRHIDELEVRAKELLAAGAALSTRDLAISGHDLMKEFSLKPGPVIGRVLDALLELVLESPETNNREALLNEAGRLAATLKTP